ncbi:MAG: VWA domain-containing protein [Bacteroidetes bacterium]|nr:VWA domain-containing protein [Bacteroidota bacterium]MBT7464580.1 VWA domain-containing protein [Bacteroidota bacterium]
MKKQVVIYQLVLDRSGSMGSVTEETISGFNEQVQRIHELAEQYPNQKICVNLCLFNHLVEQTLKNVSAGILQELSFKSYRPEGMTALYDAVGSSIRQVKKQIKMLTDEVKYKVYFVILTDGHENASRQFRYEKIKKSIKKLEDTKKWEFSYLGSTLDAVEIATSLNIKSSNATYFRKDRIQESFGGVSDKFSSWVDDFSTEIEEEEKENKE